MKDTKTLQLKRLLQIKKNWVNSTWEYHSKVIKSEFKLTKKQFENDALDLVDLCEFHPDLAFSIGYLVAINDEIKNYKQ